MSKMNRAWIELDMDNLEHNVSLLRSMLPPDCALMPAIKANAYGHGSVLIARELNAMGVDAFCVAELREGIELRQSGVEGEILILGYTDPEKAPLLVRYHLTQTVVDSQHARALDAWGQELQVHIKVDTGMHRLGESWQHTDKILEIFRCKNLVVEGMYTHFCAADDPEYTRLQTERFYCLTAKLEAAGISLPRLHTQSSYSVLTARDTRCNYARVGIAMYGLLSTARDRERFTMPLRPVLSVKARVELIRPVGPGEAVGYGPEFTAKAPMRVAAVAIGYADGIPRSLAGSGAVLINGKRAPIVGRICMDQLLVDVTGIPGARQGDVAVIIGKSGDCEITAYDIATLTDTITNEVLSRLGSRLERVAVRAEHRPVSFGMLQHKQ